VSEHPGKETEIPVMSFPAQLSRAIEALTKAIRQVMAMLCPAKTPSDREIAKP